MAVTVTTFQESYPEFRATNTTLVKRKLEAATRRVAPTVWGNKTDDGIMLLTAHLLSIAPAGEQARLKVDNRGDAYETEYESLRRSAAMAKGRNT